MEAGDVCFSVVFEQFDKAAAEMPLVLLNKQALTSLGDDIDFQSRTKQTKKKKTHVDLHTYVKFSLSTLGKHPPLEVSFVLSASDPWRQEDCNFKVMFQNKRKKNFEIQESLVCSGRRTGDFEEFIYPLKREQKQIDDDTKARPKEGLSLCPHKQDQKERREKKSTKTT